MLYICILLIQTKKKEIKKMTNSEKYFEEIKTFAQRATEVLATKPNCFMYNMIHKEVMGHFRKAEGADCEFTIYRELVAIKVWMKRLEAGIF